jgi:hypothetical protein
VTSPAYSPTSVYSSPTAVSSTSTPVYVNPAERFNTSPSAPLVKPQSTASQVSQTLNANSSEPFLKISTPSGVAIYAEYGKVVSSTQFSSDLAAANATETVNYIPATGAVRSIQNTLYNQGATVGPQYSTSPQEYASELNFQQRADLANSVPTNRGAVLSLQNTLYNQGAIIGPQYSTTPNQLIALQKQQTPSSGISISGPGGSVLNDIVNAAGYGGFFLSLAPREAYSLITTGKSTYIPLPSQSEVYSAGSFGLLSGAAVGVGFVAAPLEAAIIPALGLSGSGATLAGLGVQAGLGAGFGGISSFVTGGNPLTGAALGALIFPASGIVSRGIAAAIPRGYSFLQGLSPTSTRELVGGDIPLLSRYTPPEEIGDAEFVQSPGQQVTVKGSYLSTIFARESGDISASGEPQSGVSAMTESDVLQSSLLSQKDLDSIANTSGKGFMENLTSAAPGKAVGVSTPGNFYQDLVSRGEAVSQEAAMAPPTARSTEVANLFAKYDAGLTNLQQTGATTILQEAPETEVATESPMSALDKAIQEAREQVAIRVSITRAIAGGQTTDQGYDTFVAYPPGTSAPTAPPRLSTLSFQGLSTLQGLSSLSATGLSLLSSQGLGQSSLQSLTSLQSESTVQVPAQVQGLGTDLALGLRTTQLQSLRSQSVEISTPYLLDSILPLTRQKKRKQRFRPTQQRNRVAMEIGSSFGDFAAALEQSDIFGSTGYFSTGRKRKR